MVQPQHNYRAQLLEKQWRSGEFLSLPTLSRKLSLFSSGDIHLIFYSGGEPIIIDKIPSLARESPT